MHPQCLISSCRQDAVRSMQLFIHGCGAGCQLLEGHIANKKDARNARLTCNKTTYNKDDDDDDKNNNINNRSTNPVATRQETDTVLRNP